MLHRFKALGLLLLITGFTLLNAQNYSNSPYTRFGLGDLQNSGFVYNKAFGGASSAIRTSNQLNYLNPASFTSQDTNTFLLQSGLTGRFVKLYNDDFKAWRNNVNLNYLVFGFPVGKYLNSSIGLVPYSRVEYHFTQDALADKNQTLIQQYDGSGGLNEFYLGLSGEIYKSISIGASLNYLFGSFERNRLTKYTTSTSATININENYVADDIFFRFGLQIHPTIGTYHKPVLGIAYEAAVDIESKADNLFTHYYTVSGTQTISSLADSSYIISLPQKLSIGLSYYYKDRIMITGEYITQDWSKLVEVNDYTSIRGGIGYRHRSLTERSRSGYFEHIEFRLGGHYTNTYVTIAGTDILDYGLSFGVGLPWKNYRKVFTSTAFNISYEYGMRGSKENGLLMENYHNISFGVVLQDYWFFKSKYD